MNILGLSISVVPVTNAQKWSRRALALAAANAVVLGGGLAYAAWTSTGSGVGASQARGFNTPTFTAGSAPSAALYPGLTADGSTAGGDLTVLVTNNNPFPVSITNITAGSAGTFTVTGGTNNANCAASTGVSVITKANPTVVGTIAANAVATPVTIKQVVSMSTASDTGCQGATITFPTAGVSLTFTSS